ncbi:MAG: phospholipase D-like domain-containing protein, partial [Bdellovibrio sp.]
GMVGRFLGGDQYDEVNEAFRDILAQSRQVKISTIFFYLSDNSRSHLQRFLKRGGSIFIYSNQSSSFSAVLDKEEDYQSKSLEVMQSEEIRNLRSYGDVEIHLFRPGKMLFYHSKFVVGDKAVIITSSNMNYASDKNSEENGFLFKSVVFADYMRDFSSDMEKEYFSKDHPEGKPGVLENISGSILRNFF